MAVLVSLLLFLCTSFTVEHKAQDKLADAQHKTVKNQLTAEANERFSRAIEQIGDSKEAKDNEGNLLPNIEVRLGGLYTLEQLAKELPEIYHNTILSVLCAYLRENARIDTTTTEQTDEEPREDVQTTLTIIGRRAVLDNEPPINLNHLILDRADLYQADLQRAQFGGTSLRVADLQEADLQGAALHGVSLGWANLKSSNISKAQLQSARVDENTIFPDGKKYAREELKDMGMRSWLED